MALSRRVNCASSSTTSTFIRSRVSFRVQRVTDAACEYGRREWFLQVVEAPLEQSVTDHGLVGIARHKQHAHRGPLGADLFRQIEAAPPGHHDVGYDQVDLALV